MSVHFLPTPAHIMEYASPFSRAQIDEQRGEDRGTGGHRFFFFFFFFFFLGGGAFDENLGPQNYLIISWYLHVWNGVAVAAYSRLAS